jgi:hypothetical protein
MSMIDIPLLDDDYREAFLYLMDEINTVMSCSDNKEPWYPRDEERLEFNLRVYRRWHADPDKNTILNFPWPKPGRIPKVPADCLKPTDDEKKKVKDFIEENDGPDMDPFTGMIVKLAKELIKEIH